MPGHFDESNQAAGRKSTLVNVGANKPQLDDHDKRVIDETSKGTYTYKGSKTGFPGLPDNEKDVGGLESYSYPMTSNGAPHRDAMQRCWQAPSLFVQVTPHPRAASKLGHHGEPVPLVVRPVEGQVIVRGQPKC